VIVAIIAFLWLGLGRVALALLVGISCGISGSAIFGLSMPHLLRLLARDPKVAAGPVALVAADLLTLTLYFGVARALLG
jgi:magnesium transporter